MDAITIIGVILWGLGISFVWAPTVGKAHGKVAGWLACAVIMLVALLLGVAAPWVYDGKHLLWGFQ
ncbi:MAG: hypothetical protein KA795_11645 [Burkholderiaceae bacterium]|nr:hypothetical protein [Burkholderiaceae bacterium]